MIAIGYLVWYTNNMGTENIDSKVKIYRCARNIRGYCNAVNSEEGVPTSAKGPVGSTNGFMCIEERYVLHPSQIRCEAASFSSVVVDEERARSMINLADF